MSGVRRMLDDSSLPPEITERISALLEQTGFEGERAADVAGELIAHFEDGLAAGLGAAELLEAFGDPQSTAELIARSKPRAERSARKMVERGARRDFPLARVWRDMRYAVRRMAQSPGFTAIAIVSLAVGIGANTAIFSLVNAVILREVPVEAPEELVEIYQSSSGFEHNVFSYPDFREFRDASTDVFEAVSVSGFSFASVDTPDGVEMLMAEAVSGEYFPLLGIRPAVGRLFGPEDDVAPDAHPVVVLGHGYWQRVFGGDPAAVGGSLRISGLEYEIVGVVPEWYGGNIRGLVPDLYVPVMMANAIQPGLDRFNQRDAHWLFGKARLKAGVPMDQVEARLETIAADLKASYPESWQPEHYFHVVPSNDVLLFPPIDQFLVPAAGLFMTLVGVVLLVACANLASFLLARAMDRQKEIAVRVAMGATRGSIVRQLLTETLLLGLVGGLAGIGVAVWLLRMLFAADLPLPIPIAIDAGVDTTVLSFSLAISIAAGLFFGIFPALHGSRGDVASTLKEGGLGANRPRRVLLRNSLVVAQVALSLVLLVAAGLFVRSARATQAVDPGFGQRPAGVLTIAISEARYDATTGRQFVRTLLDRVEQIPGVDAAGVTNNLHLNPINTLMIEFNIDGVEPPDGGDFLMADAAVADAGYFDAAGIRILRGRNFSDADTEEATPAAIVSEAFARRYWPDESAVGKVIRRPAEDDPDLVVVGVASDAKVRTLGEAPRPFVYRAYGQRYTPFVTIVARTAVDAETTAMSMLAAGRELDPQLTVFETKSIQRHLDVMLLPARLAALVLIAFAGVSLLLASIGLYGIVSYAVAQRTREVGIRLSLGADQSSVVRMLTMGGMRLVVIGGLVGLALSLLMGRAMAMLLFGVGSFDPVTFIGVPLVLLTVAFAAAYLPARRASRIDPVIALRSE